jgi:hypothetical protein
MQHATQEAPIELKPQASLPAQPGGRIGSLQMVLKNHEPSQMTIPREKRIQAEDTIQPVKTIKSETTPPANVRAEFKPVRDEASQPKIIPQAPRSETPLPPAPAIKPRIIDPVFPSKHQTTKSQVPNLNPRPSKPETPLKQSKPESDPRLVIDRLRVEVIPTAQPAQTVVVRRVSAQGSGDTRRSASQLRFGLGQL